MRGFWREKTAALAASLIGAVLLLAPAGCVHFDDDPKAIERPFFWRIEGGKGTSYLLGTMHTGVSAETELTDEVWRPFNDIKCLALESNGRAVDGAEVARRAQLPPGQRLSALVSKSVWATLRKRLAPTYAEAELDRLAPWYVALILSVEGEPAGEKDPGMDQVLQSRATSQHKRLVFLEDWRDALTVVAETTTVHDLTELVESPDEADDERRELTAAYRRGDEDRLAALFEEMADESEGQAQLERLLNDRNRAWMPGLVKTLQAGPCFIAVGAGHVVGKSSLRTLLAKQGFKTTRVLAPSPDAAIHP